jgi:hypothetical protein
MLKCFNQANNILLSSDIKDNRDRDKDIRSFSNLNIPLDPQEFYRDFGLLLHPKTGEFVSNLTNYQYQIWKDKYNSKYRLILKSQKVGITTSVLLEDFQDSITRYKGQDILIIAQTQNHANEHLRTLKNLILNSEKYRQFLITNPSELLLKEEKSKVSVAYIKNIDNPLRPSRIIALGASEGSVWSWKNVSKIHMSDIAATSLVDDSGLFAAAFSRLANTDGSLIIETPPRGARGRVYEIFEQIQKGESEFSLHIVTADQGVQAGLINAEFLNAEKQRLGYLFPQYYQAQFLEGSGNLFLISSIDKAVKLGEQFNPDEFRTNSIKIITVDQGYSSSLFCILVVEWNLDNRQIRILHGEEHQSPLFEFMLDRVLQLRKKYGNVLNIFYDATSRNEFGTALKTKISEVSYWPKVKQKMEESIRRGISIEKRMVVVPVIFSTESKLQMSAKLQQILDDSRGLIAIPPKFNKLIVSLKSAVFDERGLLDKNISLYNDWLDCLFMATKFFRFRNDN